MGETAEQIGVPATADPVGDHSVVLDEIRSRDWRKDRMAIVGEYEPFGVPLGRDLPSMSGNEPALGQPADKIDARAIESALDGFVAALGLHTQRTPRQRALIAAAWLRLLEASRDHKG